MTKHDPPIPEDKLNELLKPHETLRDPVHQDINITALERVIIDTQSFQRLRFLKQLGPTDLVYPGAVHTRFLHSLGTLHCAEYLVNIVNRNYDIYSSMQKTFIKIEKYPHLLIRLSALLHDVVHMPYGHTLEDEGNLAKPEWEDSDRAKHWLGNETTESELTRAIKGFLVEFGIPKEVAILFINDLRKYILHKGDPMDLDYPYVNDIVGNTLCADLLDYIERDMYFAGLKERAGDRVVKYVAIMRIRPKTEKERTTQEFLPEDEPTKGKGRVVLLAYRFEREHLASGALKAVRKTEMLSEAIDLLRLRYALAEKVYFHRTKLAASAMLISAMGSSSIKFEEPLYGISDEQFLNLLEGDPNPRVTYLIRAYKSRQLYKPIYYINYHEERDTEHQSLKLWRDLYPNFRRPEWRKEKEMLIEKYSCLPEGSVAIYCPDRDMNLKEFEMLVQNEPGREIKPLSDILDKLRRDEMIVINSRYTQLWRFMIYVDPEVLDVSKVSTQKVQDFNALCEEIIDFPNDNPELQRKGRPLKDQLAWLVINEYRKKTGKPIDAGVHEQLIAASHKGGESDILETMRKTLEATMAKKQLDLDLE